MTNDRRKTFTTPLEFWQWAIQFPHKRKARASGGEIAQVQIGGSGKVYLQLGDGYILSVDCLSCPLTAIEDEHGVIEEKQSQDYITDIEAAIGIIAVIEGDIVPASREAYTQTSTGLLIDAIRKIADERIAAAKVEWYGPHGNWAVDHNCRLKPKGDA